MRSDDVGSDCGVAVPGGSVACAPRQLLLAADIHEAILFLPPIESGKDPVTEKDLRPVVAEVDWERQREVWGAFDQYHLQRDAGEVRTGGY